MVKKDLVPRQKTKTAHKLPADLNYDLVPRQKTKLHRNYPQISTGK